VETLPQGLKGLIDSIHIDRNPQICMEKCKKAPKPDFSGDKFGISSPYSMSDSENRGKWS
jgi:hypothetical protein